MTIQTIPRRLPEVGRLRLGERQPTRNGTRPAALAAWRLTSKSRFRLEAAAKLYGGQVREWKDAPGEDDQFELYTEAKALRVAVIPTIPVSQFYEHWTAAGCQRRCDGLTETISGESCICNFEVEHPQDFLCKPTTRLSVLLPDLPGLGVWRVETHGYYGAAELAATAELLASLGRPMPVALVIDQRSEKRPGQPRRDYVVPMLDSKQSFMDLQMLAAADPVTGELGMDEGRALAPRDPPPSSTSGGGERVTLRETEPVGSDRDDPPPDSTSGEVGREPELHRSGSNQASRHPSPDPSSTTGARATDTQLSGAAGVDDTGVGSASGVPGSTGADPTSDQSLTMTWCGERGVNPRHARLHLAQVHKAEFGDLRDWRDLAELEGERAAKAILYLDAGFNEQDQPGPGGR